MIFVTVGSLGKFDELIIKVDELVKKGKILDKTIIQLGNSSFIPKHCDWFRFENEITDYYKKAKFVISHEGAGTLFELLRLKKKVISVTNKNTVDNPDIVKVLSLKKHLLHCKKINDLEKYIDEIINVRLLEYQPTNCNIHNYINNFIN